MSAQGRVQRLALACVLAARAGWPVVGDAGAQASAERTLAYLDRDADGRIGLNEYLVFQQPRLSQFDANGNGRLSRAEFKASLSAKAQRNAARSFRAFDLDRDNGLSQEEFLGYHAWIFKNYLDANRDGFITAEEWRKVLDG